MFTYVQNYYILFGMVYTNEQKAGALAALRANNGNISKTARMLKINTITLRSWREAAKTSPELSAKVAGKVEEISSRLDKIIHLLITEIPNKIENANLSQLTAALGTAIDKKNLLLGKPTSISESRSEKQRYQAAMDDLIKQAAKDGIKISPAEAIDLLESHLPEIRKHVTIH